MKIGLTYLPQPMTVKREKTDKAPATEQTVLEQMQASKQAVRDAAQKHLSELQEARTDMGEDDPKAQRYIEKFKNGKKLTPEEMAYVRKHAPGIVDYIDRIMRDREMIERSMRVAPTKTDVQMVAYRAGKQIEKYQNPEEREIRARHLVDAKHEYEQTEEYKAKPSSPLEKEDPRVKVHVKRDEKQHISLAQSAYEPLDYKEIKPSIQFKQ